MAKGNRGKRINRRARTSRTEWGSFGTSTPEGIALGTSYDDDGTARRLPKKANLAPNRPLTGEPATRAYMDALREIDVLRTARGAPGADGVIKLLEDEGRLLEALQTGEHMRESVHGLIDALAGQGLYDAVNWGDESKGGAYRTIRKALSLAIANDPLYKSALPHFHRKDNRWSWTRNTISTAREALQERLLLLMILANQPTDDTLPEWPGNPYDWGLDEPPPSDVDWAETVGLARDALTLSVALMARVAPCYLWLDEMRETAMSFELPRHIPGPAYMSQPVMWWTFESDLSTPALPGWVLFGGLLHARADSIQVVLVASHAETRQRVELLPFAITYGRTWPEDFEDTPLAEGILKLLAFMNSPYVGAQTRVLDRTERRARLRAKLDVQPEEEHVRVVHLRQAERDVSALDEPQAREKPDPTGRHVKVRFWVRGHYRAQWYRSTQEHKVIWIAPVLKGPADAPMKQAKRVYRVDR